MMKSIVQSKFALIITLVLIVITQGIVVHAAQEIMQDAKWVPFPGVVVLDLLKHYP